MTDYGTKIAELRAANKMTQAQLGKQLNVTSQAVSKWEKGLSEPDIESIRKICQIFNITFDEFFGAEPKQEPKQEVNQETDETAQQTPDETPEETPTEAPAEKTEETPTESAAEIINYCASCAKPLYSTKEYKVIMKDGRHRAVCLDCVPWEEQKSQEEQAKAEHADNTREEQLETKSRWRQSEEWAGVKKGLLWGILGGVVLAGIMLALGIWQNDPLIYLLGTFLGLYGGYALVAQFIWENSVWDVLGFFMRTFKLPGVIFTLSIDGLLFLIFVKVAGAILSAMISLILFIIGFIVTWAYAMIIFPFALIKQLHEIKQMN